MHEPLSTRYQVLQVFKGGSSLLQKAKDLRSDQTVVLKFPSTPKLPDAQERITREARAFEHLGDIPGLVQYIGYEENPGNPRGPFLALEFLQGNTLAERLELLGTFSEEDTISIGRRVCQIVSRLHARRVVHRDLSLKNILLLEGTDEVRLIDLGLALVQRTDNSYEPYDKGKIGTPTTRAPEISDSYPGDKRSDIYSLGKVLYQLVNGQENSGQELQGLAPKAKSRVSNELSDVIVRCVQKSPKARYQTAQDLDHALRALQRKSQAKKLAVRFSPMVGVLLLAGVAYSFGRPKETIPTPQSAPVVAPTSVKADTMPTLTTTTQPAEPPKKQEEAKAPVQQKKPKPAPKEAPPEVSKEPTKVVTQVSDSDEEETDALARAKLLKIATEPTPIVKPQPIEIRFTTKKN